MGLKQNIIVKVKEILDNKFEVEEVTIVPDITNTKLTFGNKGLQFEATVLYIDMRGSTEILNKHTNPVVAKIHMSYFHTIVKIAKSLGGEVRSFNGDSMLVFFPGTTKITLSNAVKAAMEMKYMLCDTSNGINVFLNKYTQVDFGIGIDDGKILCTKIGIAGDSNNKDLIWIGNPVNKAVVISDECSNPYHIAISEYVYNNLTNEVKYDVKQNIFGFDENVDIWAKSSIKYNGNWENYYYTTYLETVD